MLGLAKASTLAAAQDEIARLTEMLDAARAELVTARANAARDAKVYAERVAEATRVAEARAGETAEVREKAESCIAAGERTRLKLEESIRAIEARHTAIVESMVQTHSAEIDAAYAAGLRIQQELAEERAANEKLRAGAAEAAAHAATTIEELSRQIPALRAAAHAAETRASAVESNLRRQASEHAAALDAATTAHRREVAQLRREIDGLRASK